MSTGVLTAGVSTPHVYSAHKGHKRTREHLGQEFQKIVNCCVGAGN